MLSVSRYTLTKVKLLLLLEKLKADPIGIGTLCVPPRSSKTNIEGLLETVMDVKTVPEDLYSSITESQTGGILFWGPYHWKCFITTIQTTIFRIVSIATTRSVD
jgi:hypothetical protein